MATILGQSGSWKSVQSWLNAMEVVANSPEDLYQQFELLKQKRERQQEDTELEIIREIRILQEEITYRQTNLNADIDQCRMQTAERIAVISTELDRYSMALKTQLTTIENQISAAILKLSQQSNLHENQIKQATIRIEQQYDEKFTILGKNKYETDIRFQTQLSLLNEQIVALNHEVIPLNIQSIINTISALETAQAKEESKGFVSQTWSWLKCVFSGKMPPFYSIKLLYLRNKKERLENQIKQAHQQQLSQLNSKKVDLKDRYDADLQNIDLQQRRLFDDKKREIERTRKNLIAEQHLAEQHKELSKLKQWKVTVLAEHETKCQVLKDQQANLKRKEKEDIAQLHQNIRVYKERQNLLRTDKEKLIAEGCQQLDGLIYNVDKVLHSKEFIGATAELDAVKQLSKLPEHYYILNDVNLTAMRRMTHNDRIVRSAQIDLLVIATTGVFVIEVKHWSQQFVESGQFYDPYEQVGRARYLCDCLLKEELNIPIEVRSILAYRGHLPQKTAGSRVKVLLIDGLANYINDFQFPMLSTLQLQTIINWLPH